MVCYAVPLAAAIGLHALGRHSEKVRPGQAQLVLMLAGGSTFGIVDHLWNGELLMIGSNLASDLALGLAITAAITALWAISTRLSAVAHSGAASLAAQ